MYPRLDPREEEITVLGSRTDAPAKHGVSGTHAPNGHKTGSIETGISHPNSPNLRFRNEHQIIGNPDPGPDPIPWRKIGFWIVIGCAEAAFVWAALNRGELHTTFVLKTPCGEPPKS